MSEVEVTEKPKKFEKASVLPVYDCEINVAKITRHVVQKTGVTAAELAILIAQFGRGPEGVDKIEEGVQPSTVEPAGLTEKGGSARKTVKITYTVPNELPRLREKYGPRIVKHVFGAGMSAMIPRTLDDLNEMVIEPYTKRDEAEAA